MRIRRRLAALGAFFALALIVAGCGSSSSVPSGAVATVAGNPISLHAYEHSMYVTAKRSAASQPGAPVIVPGRPPNFELCVRAARASIPTLKTTPLATLRSDCSQLFTQLNNDVLGQLIAAYWIQADAHKLGVSYSRTDLMKELASEKKAAGFKTDAEYHAALASSGETQQDLLFNIRVSQLLKKLMKRVQKPVTKRQIASYYRAHKSQFGTPETRDIHLIRTAKAASAQSAFDALKAGASWDTVAKRYAADASSKLNGGLLDGVTDGQEPNDVNKVIFSSPAGKLLGPIHGVLGDYVVEVTKITPAVQQPLAKVSSQISSTLTQQASNDAQTSVIKHAKADWGAKTKCLTAYAIPDCAGYKPPKAVTSPAAPQTTPSTTTPSKTTPSKTTPAKTTKTKAGS